MSIKSNLLRPNQKSINITSNKTVSLFHIFCVFFQLGSTVFGGMWAATQKLEKLLVEREGWINREELQSLIIASTLIPAPKFLALSGLIGFQLRKWLGALCAVMGLFIPPASLVLLGVFLINPSLLTGSLAPLNKSLSIVIVGILFGNAFRQIKGSNANKKERLIGITLSFLILSSIVIGVPLIIAAFFGFVLGALFLRSKQTQDKEEGETH